MSKIVSKNWIQIYLVVKVLYMIMRVRNMIAKSHINKMKKIQMILTLIIKLVNLIVFNILDLESKLNDKKGKFRRKKP